jgi:archaemetzincin
LSQQGILLISYANFENNFLEEIAHEVGKEFHMPVRTEVSHMDLSDFFDPMRRQYDGNAALKTLDSISSPEYGKKMGLFQVDLFIPILTYIFGQAALNGNAGVASLYRLKNEQYGMKKDDDLLLERFSKVIIHELGHMYGLIHCHLPNCVMRSSTYVEDIDQKDHSFCNKCRSELGM